MQRFILIVGRVTLNLLYKLKESDLKGEGLKLLKNKLLTKKYIVIKDSRYQKICTLLLKRFY